MITKVFAVYDSKALAYLQPFFSEQSGSAIRAFSDAVNEGGQGPIHKHPGDFLLYELGKFDMSTGLMTPLIPPTLLGNGLDFKTPTPTSAVSPSIRLAEPVVELANGSDK